MRRNRFLYLLPVLLIVAGPTACGSDPEPEVTIVESPVDGGYRAGGNEPFWWLVFDETTMDFAHLGTEDTVSVERPAAERVEDGWRFVATANGEPYVVQIEDRRCNDSMSGRPFPHTVAVTVNGQVFTGCGGDTASLLVGSEWRVTRLEGSETIDPSPTLLFESDGVLTGSGSCNRYRTTYVITGEGVTVGPAAATRMACPGEGVDAQEMRFFGALEQVTRFDIAEDGSLELLALDQPIIVARR